MSLKETNMSTDSVNVQERVKKLVKAFQDFEQVAARLTSEYRNLGLIISQFCEEVSPCLQPATYTIIPEDQWPPGDQPPQASSVTFPPSSDAKMDVASTPHSVDDDAEFICRILESEGDTEPQMVMTEGLDILETDMQITWWIKDGSLKVNRAELLKRWKSEVMAGGTTMGLVEWANVVYRDSCNA
jgi:hypothetical protein